MTKVLNHPPPFLKKITGPGADTKASPGNGNLQPSNADEGLCTDCVRILEAVFHSVVREMAAPSFIISYKEIDRPSLTISSQSIKGL